MLPSPKIDRPTPSGLDGAGSPLPVAPGFKSVAPLDLKHLARRPVAVPAQAPAQVPGAKPVKPALPAGRAGHDTALDLLSDVSSALSALMTRCQDLEGALETAKAEVEAANATAREWQQLAQGLRAQVDHLEKGLSGAKQQIAAAEQRATSVEAIAAQSQQAAAEAECLSSLFQDKVMSSFGVGSVGHAILESVRNRTNTMLTA